MDNGLRNYLLGYRDGDSGHILENIIYFELLRRGYDVAIGKLDNREVDFIATKTDEKKYIQVTESMNAPETREQALFALFTRRFSRSGYHPTVRNALSKRWKITAAWARLLRLMGARVSGVMPLMMPLLTAQPQASTAKGRTLPASW